MKINQEASKIRMNKIILSVVFLFSLTVVLISLVSVVFPVLIASNNSTISELEELGIDILEINPFTIGIWALPLIAANIVIFVITLLYFKKKLPESIKKPIEFVFSFEISKKTAFVAIAILLAFIVIESLGDLTTEDEWTDYPVLKKKIEAWTPDKVTEGIIPHVKYVLILSSMNLFGYYTIIPLIASTALVLLTYFFTVEITKKRFAGIISSLILVQSHVFLVYDSTVSYTNFWTLFYLLSLYLIYKAWPLSPLSYIFSILSKALTVIFLPMSLYFIFRANITRTKKIIIASSSSVILIAGALAGASGFEIGEGLKEEFDSDEFWLGFTSFSYQLRFDGLVLVFILPLIVGLFIASRNRIIHADSIMVFLGGMLLIPPFLTGFTELTNLPYRFIPLVVFFAIGVGVLLSKRKN